MPADDRTALGHAHVENKITQELAGRSLCFFCELSNPFQDAVISPDFQTFIKNCCHVQTSVSPHGWGNKKTLQSTLFCLSAC
jgi:hypothetical protein